jgi:hypothetical protein
LLLGVDFCSLDVYKRDSASTDEREVITACQTELATAPPEELRLRAAEAAVGENIGIEWIKLFERGAAGPSGRTGLRLHDV